MVDMIKYPTYNGGQLDDEEKITRDEEAQVVEILNSLIEKGQKEPDIHLLQRFITNYESLRYFRDVHTGLVVAEDCADVNAPKPIQLPDVDEVPRVWQIK